MESKNEFGQIYDMKVFFKVSSISGFDKNQRHDLQYSQIKGYGSNLCGKEKRELRVTCYEFKSTTYEFKSTSYQFKSTS